MKSMKSDGDTAVIEYQLSSGLYPLDMQIAFLAGKPTQSKPVYIYYDPNYDWFFWTTREAVYYLIRHLTAELEIRGYDAGVEVLDAHQLKDFLLKTETARSSILIAANGALPDTVLTKNRDLVKPWVESGGTFFWISDYFLFYSAEPRPLRPLEWENPAHPGFKEAEEFFGMKNAILTNKQGSRATVGSEYSKALDLKYSHAFRPLSLLAVTQLGGKILGMLDTTNANGASASIVSVPVGEGIVVLFGGAMLSGEEMRVARDIAQILHSGVLEQQVIGYKSFHLERNQKVIDSYQIGVIDQKAEPGVTIYIFQKGSNGAFFDKKYTGLTRNY